MTGTANQPVPAATCTLLCRGCRTRTTVPAAASEFDCAFCATHNAIYRCESCGQPDIVPSRRGVAPGGWTCTWCLHQNTIATIPRRQRKHAATAAEAQQILQAHGVSPQEIDLRLLGGFTMLAGSGDCPPARTICSIAGLNAGVLITAEAGATGSVLLPYKDLLELKVGGHGLITRDAGITGGGLGIRGALTGIAMASLVNNATRKTTVDSFIRLITSQTEMLLSHHRYTPKQIRNSLSPIFVRHLAATRTPITPPAQPATPLPAAQSGPVDELERLTRLHAAGTLTDTEFEAARAKHIRQLRNPTS